MTIVGNQTVIWNHNGEFQKEIKVFVRLTEGGTFEVVKTSYDGQTSSAVRKEKSIGAITKDKKRAASLSTAGVPGSNHSSAPEASRAHTSHNQTTSY